MTIYFIPRDIYIYVRCFLSCVLTFSQAGFFISDSNLEYSKLSYTIVSIFQSTSSKIPTINIAPEIPRPIVSGSGGPGGHPKGEIVKVLSQAQSIAIFKIIIIGLFLDFVCLFGFFFYFSLFFLFKKKTQQAVIR